MANLLIENALQEIAREYKPGLLVWLKHQPDKWVRFLELEVSINQAAFSKDEAGLMNALEAYCLFFQEMTKAYGERRSGKPLLFEEN